MNDQALAILTSAVSQLQALSNAQQQQIDADTQDAAQLQAQLDADNADIAIQTNAKASTDSVTASLQDLINSLTVALRK